MSFDAINLHQSDRTVLIRHDNIKVSMNGEYGQDGWLFYGGGLMGTLGAFIEENSQPKGVLSAYLTHFITYQRKSEIRVTMIT